MRLLQKIDASRLQRIDRTRRVQPLGQGMELRNVAKNAVNEE